MPDGNRTTRWWRILASGAALLAISVWACSVPVFRYALERWVADPYQAIVFHRGPLTESQKALTGDLSADGLAGRSHVNLFLRTVDLDEERKPEMLDVWRESGGSTLPWLVVKYPSALRLPGNAWSGPLSEEATRRLVDSPARKKIVQRLAQGESAVWVMLDSGDPRKDETAAKLLESRLDYLTATLKLPKLDAQDVVNGLISIPENDLRLEFSTLRVARSDPAEQAFVKMLLGTEADLKGVGEPIVFPVFGRGRVLYALVGKGIRHETIDQAATFLIGKCSCEVKERNPGVDLLLAADWTNIVKTQFNPDRDLPALTNLLGRLPVTVTISGSGDVPATTGSRGVGGIRTPLIATGFGIVALIAAGVFLWARKG